jgi:hypothetical protein
VPKYVVSLHGGYVQLASDQQLGFYATRVVRSADASSARDVVRRLILGELMAKKIEVVDGALAFLDAEQILEARWWARRGRGFTFYPR